MHILIVEARFYDALIDELVKGARAAIEAADATWDVVSVPGALEIPGAINFAADSGRYDGYVAIGAVIRGETTHYEIVTSESARGLMDLTIHHGLAIGNGIITVENEDQAWRRAKTDELNKGAAAAEAAMTMVQLQREFSGENL